MRIDLSAIADRLTDQLPQGTYVSTAQANDYLTAFGKQWPAVWVVAQRLTPTDDGDGWSGAARQGVRIEVVVRILVQRLAEGVTDNSAALNDLHDAVASALFGWTPADADTPLVWRQSVDGAPSETLLTADMIFATESTYRGTP